MNSRIHVLFLKSAKMLENMLKYWKKLYDFNIQNVLKSTLI